MPTVLDLIVRNGTVVNQNGTGLADIGVKEGVIVAIGDLATRDAAETIDATGLTILPGVIDSQVHFREPGMEHKEDLASGSRAAVLGGVTAVFEMPNTRPTTTDAQALADKITRATGRMACDFAFWFGATADNTDDLEEAERLPGSAGIKMFMGSSTGDLLVDESEHVARVLRNGRRRVAVHSEEESRLKERAHLRVEGDPSSHPVWRDARAAYLCTDRLIKLAREARRRIHVLHISTADELPLLAGHKDLVTAEATPHHLTLSSDDYRTLGTLVQMNPPVRDIAHQVALWEAIRNGTIDVLGSDHAPHTLEEKAARYPGSPSGMTGVQTLVPIMLDHVNAGRLTLERLVDLTSHGPNRLFGIAGKGRIALGYDADFTIVDMRERRTIENGWIASRAAWTPYDGREVTGWPKGTIIRGNRVMWEDEIVGTPQGAPVRFIEGCVDPDA